MHLGTFGTSTQLFGITADNEVVVEVEAVELGVACEDGEGAPTHISAAPVNACTFVALLPLNVKLNSSLLSSSSWGFLSNMQVFEFMIYKLWLINYDLNRIDIWKHWYWFLNSLKNKVRIVNFRHWWNPSFNIAFEGIFGIIKFSENFSKISGNSPIGNEKMNNPALVESPIWNQWTSLWRKQYERQQ